MVIRAEEVMKRLVVMCGDQRGVVMKRLVVKCGNEDGCGAT